MINVIFISIDIFKMIRTGENNKFYGIPIFDRRLLSKISIENNCRIRSYLTTNLTTKKNTLFEFIENDRKVGYNTLNELGIQFRRSI